MDKADTGTGCPAHRPDRTLLRHAASLLLSVLCLWLAFRDVPLSSTARVIGRASPWLVLLACLGTLGMNAFKCQKIGLLLSRAMSIRYRTLLAAELISVLVDVIFPFRLQELVKAFVIGRREALRPSLVLGAEIVEKTVEVLFLSSVMLALWLMLPTPDWASSLTWLFVAITGAAFAFLLLIVFRPDMLEGPIQRLQRTSLPGARRLSGSLSCMSVGFRLAADRPQAMVGVVGLTALEWGFLAASLYACALALDIHLDATQMMGALVANYLAFAVPTSSSGSVGIYELTGKAALVHLFGMDPSEALGLVVLFHAVLIGFGALSGAVALATTRISIWDVRDKVQDPLALELPSRRAPPHPGSS